MTRYLGFIDNALGRFFRRVELATAVSSDQLAAFRIFFGALLLMYFLPSWSWLNEVPPAFFNPKLLSFAYLTDNYLPGPVFVVLDILVILLLLCITLGIHTRKCLLLMYVISGILYSYSFSFGKIDHFTNLFLFVYPVLACTNSGTRYALVKDKEVSDMIQSRSLAALGIIIAFGFFTAGSAKCLRWIDFDLQTSGFLDWFYYSYFIDQNQDLLAPFIFKVPQQVFEIADYTAALFEISGFLFLLKGKRAWIIFLTIASVFHLINILTFNMSFALNVLCFGVFLISPVLFRPVKRRAFNFLRYRRLFIGFALGMAVVKIVLVLAGIRTFTYHDNHILQGFENVADSFLWLFSIACGLFLLKNEMYSADEVKG